MITMYRKHRLNRLRFSSMAIIDLQVLLYQINIWVHFQLFFIFYHLHKLISPLSIEFISMELRLHYVCIPIYCDIFASGLLLITETTKRFELNKFNVAITTTGRLGLRWLPTVSWRMQIFAFSNRSLGRGVAAYTYF